jgi:hypothetical protein
MPTEATTRRKIGRPLKLTPEVQGLVEAIERGAYKAVAAAHAAVTARTLYRWLETGEADDEHDRDTGFRQFFQALRTAALSAMRAPREVCASRAG